MNKDIIRFFVPDCIIVFIGIIKAFCRAAKMRIRGIKTPKVTEDKVIIVGTGPSLQTTIKEAENVLKNTACIVVNGFATSPLYEDIKPKYYILADPVYFTPMNSLSDRNKGVVRNLRDALIKKTNWNVIFIFPYTAMDTELYNSLLSIKTASFQFYNNAGNAIVIPDWKIKFKLWNKGLIAPLCQTVLNTAASIAITSRVQNIYLVGADTSWLSTYEIDQNDNTLYSKDEHFYGINRIPIYSDEIKRKKQYLHDELKYVGQAFKFYYILEKYAKYNRVNFFNASAYSWIDALDRCVLGDSNKVQ